MGNPQAVISPITRIKQALIYGEAVFFFIAPNQGFDSDIVWQLEHDKKPKALPGVHLAMMLQGYETGYVEAMSNVLYQEMADRFIVVEEIDSVMSLIPCLFDFEISIETGTEALKVIDQILAGPNAAEIRAKAKMIIGDHRPFPPENIEHYLTNYGDSFILAKQFIAELFNI